MEYRKIELIREEITFEKIPKEIIKTEIKRIGFKYDYIKKKWYAPETLILIGEIKKIFGNNNGKTQTIQ